MSDVQWAPISWERMSRAVDKVRERLTRAVTALEAAGIRHAVAGGNAVAAWVSRVDEAAVRNTRDVDILVARADLSRVVQCLESAGFTYRHSAGLDLFLDTPHSSPRDALHLVFAGEPVRPDHPSAAPDLSQVDASGPFRVVTLFDLVRMKLNSFRDKDRVHLRDLVEVGLVDESWPDRFAEPLASRLRTILETPDG